MADTTLIAAAKLAKRITTTAFDSEIGMILDAGVTDLGIAGVELPDTYDAIVKRALITYFLLNFGEPDQYDNLKKSYDEQKAQLSMATGYTDWGEE